MTGALRHEIEQKVRGEQLNLFEPPPPLRATWPAAGTHAELALKMLLDGKVLDHLDFLKITESWRLAARVSELRDLGWPIETIEVLSPTELNADRSIAHYSLDPRVAILALSRMIGTGQEAKP